jgi:protein translocase SecG subunit
MFSVMAILIIISAGLLILAVLMQPGKGDMLSGLGGMTNNLTSMFGSRRAMDLLMKITIGLAVTILVFTIITNKFFVGQDQEIVKPLIEGTQLPPSAPPAGTPAVPQMSPADKK